MHPYVSRALARLRIMAAAALLSTACGAPPPDGAGDPSDGASLVPAAAAALEAYLERAVELHLPTTRELPEADMLPISAGGVGAPRAFSTTNLQTANVDEADLVKFDGETLFVARQPFYLYDWSGPIDRIRPLDSPIFDPAPTVESIDPARVAIYAASDDPAGAEEVASIALSETAWIHGMLLLAGDDEHSPLLVVIGTDHVQTWPAPLLTDVASFHPGFQYGDARVRLWIYDVSDPLAPRALHESEIEGSLVAVRRVGDRLVLVSRFTPYVPYLMPESEGGATPAELLDDLGIQALLPRHWIPRAGAALPQPLVRPERCFVPRERADARDELYYHPTLVTITMLDLRAPDEASSVCAAGPVDRIFSSTSALYLASTDWSAVSRSVVHKFAYTDRGPEFRGSGTAAGRPGGTDPDFGVGEVGDAFGIVTIVPETTPGRFDSAPRLTLLAEVGDGSRRLEELSHLPNEREPARIGKPGEMLHAVRFVGDRLYAVTFRRIDPLYVIDITDPRNPFIAGELEVPGFSDLLQPIGSDLLLGVGKETISDVDNDWFQGVKVELFDVSAPSAPESVDAIVIGRRGSETSARTDHHALSTLDLGDGTSRVAIPIDVAEESPGATPPEEPWAWWGWSRTGLHLFEVDHDARTLRAAGALIVAEAGDEDPTPGTWNDRSRLHGDAVHYVHDERVWSAPWASPDDAVGPR